MLFSERFNVDEKNIMSYGAINVQLLCDLPLFIDPMLIFLNEKPQYQALHKNIIKYFAYLKDKAKQKLSDKEIKDLFSFREIPNNWFGYSLEGNKGKALGDDFAYFLSHNINNALGTTYEIEEHFERIMLLNPGSGKDRISDMTVNLIKRFLAEYTEQFAKKYIDGSLCHEFLVDRVKFNYEDERFISCSYILPAVKNKAGEDEFVLLTPADIVRVDEPAINHKDFINSYSAILASPICNSELRSRINRYLRDKVTQYEKEQQEKKRKISEIKIEQIKKAAFSEIALDYAGLIDSYIGLKESMTRDTRKNADRELSKQLTRFKTNVNKMISLFINSQYQPTPNASPYNEMVARIKHIKQLIEERGGKEYLFVEGEEIRVENDIIRFFKFVSEGINSLLVQKGSLSQTYEVKVHFKLASNRRLDVFLKEIRKTIIKSGGNRDIVVLIYFSKSDYRNAIRKIENAECKDIIDRTLYFIDCCIDE